MEAWQMQEKQLDPGAAVARGSLLLVRMFVHLWLVNATNLPIGAVVVATQPQLQNKEAKEEGGSIHGSMQTAAKSSTLRVMETRPKPADPKLMNPRGCRQVGPGAVTMMAYPMQRMTAFKQQGDRPQFFVLCLRIGESGWAPLLPLESSDSSSQADDMNTKPVLRLEPHCVVSNRTGTPLQIMHFNTGNKVQRLGGKATGVQPSWGQQPQRAPPGLKGVVAKPQQDWTSCIDVPTGALGVAVHWSMIHPVEAFFSGGWTDIWPGEASSESRRTNRAQRGALHHRTRQSGNGGDGPEAMDKVEVVILRFSLAACNPGCLHLVLESVSPKNCTAHPFKYRQAGLGDLPFQPLPAY
ncbi:hypothetical protein WJX82_004252 [Trebouxia sp. C0006]